MIWLIPVGIGVGAVALVLLWVGKASADSISGNGATTKDEDGPSGSDIDNGTRTNGSRSGGGGSPPPLVVGPITPLVSDVTAQPTPGHSYIIRQHDTGTGLCVKAYASPRPLVTWYSVAAHPTNVDALGTDWSRWFLPKWAPNGLNWEGSYTGHYARVYFPPSAMVQR